VFEVVLVIVPLEGLQKAQREILILPSLVVARWMLVKAVELC
jgi:hypothetical protein